MYKVFFNDRTIYLDDSLPDMTKVGNDYVCAFENITDLKPQLKQFLDPGKEGNLHIFHDNLEELFHTFKLCFNFIEAAGGLVKNPSGDLLLILRRGKWDLPKGKMEEDEDLRETALREVQEETGLQDIATGEFLMSTWHIYVEEKQQILKQTDWYSMIYTGTEAPVPMSEEEITKVEWTPASELQKIYDNTFLSIMDVLETGINNND